MSEIRLNKEQKRAVEYGKGPLLIVAGAGTGKTRVITERIKWLIENEVASPNEILALTYTEKAAQEMLTRVDTIMPLGYEEPWLSTFHAFADRILREEALEIGLDPSYKIITDSQRWILFRKNLFNFNLKYYLPLGNPSKFISAILLFFSRLQDEDVSASELLRWTESKKEKGKNKNGNQDLERWGELSRAYEKYQKIKIEENKLDFGDLIINTLTLFRKRPNILKKYQKQFKYILIDEFQDTNYAQFELIKLLCPSEDDPNLMVVGDDDQSIYKFRGASISNVLEFKKVYSKAETIILTDNYRNTQNILDRSYQLIQHNNPDRLEVKIGIDKKLKAVKTRGTKPDGLSSQKPVGLVKSKVEVLDSENGEKEAESVVKKIIEILGKETEYTYKDFAILARANNHLKPFVNALKRHGLPYQLVGNRGLFDQEEIRDLISFLRICVDPEDDLSLFHYFHIPSFGIKTSQIIKEVNYAKRNRISLWERVKDNEVFSRAVSLVEAALKKAMKEQISAILYNFIMDSSYLDPILKEESIENNLMLKNINLFMDKVKTYESSPPAGGGSGNIVEFVDYLDLMIEAGENPAQATIEDIDTVNLLTVHSAKGLEFPVVFLVNMVVGRFPTRNRRDPIPVPIDLVKETLPEGDFHLEEERRLCYVGATRAEKYLYLTYANNYGGKRETRPSGFIKELDLKVASTREDSSQLSLLDFSDQTHPVRKVSEGKLPLPGFVSYSQLNYYKICPLKYKYKYVLGLPTPPHHALSFGITIHNTLRDFYKFKIESLEELLQVYKKNFLSGGYDSKKHKEERYKAGSQALEEFFKVNARKKSEPLFLEKRFRFSIGAKPLIGVIDRVDKSESGYEIIDYKTGVLKEQKEVDKDEQLTIYALGAKEALGFIPKKLSLYFVEAGKKISTQRTEKQIEEMKKDVKERVKEIEKSDFKANPGFMCKYCEFNKICPQVYKDKS